MATNIGQDEFIRRAKLVHGDTYDYSMTKYINQRTKVRIICPIHGDFFQYPQAHIRRHHGCPQCGNEKQKIKTREFSMSRRMTKKSFIKRAKEIHNNKYDYSMIPNDISYSNKVPIICPRHGIFEQTVSGHLAGRGCIKCKYNTMTNDEFIEKARNVHGNKYNYNKTEYKNSTQKVIITCKKHGDFFQKPFTHLQGSGCPMCKNENLGVGTLRGNKELFLTNKTAWFIEEAKKIHGDKYLYDKVKYVKSNQNVIITCKKHGDFLQTPNTHLYGRGCELCAKDKLSIEFRPSLDEFIEKSNKIHFNRYDYSLVSIPERTSDKVKIICPIHGIYEQIMFLHMRGSGCPKCTKISKGEEKINDFLHRNNYSYKRQYFIKNENVLCSNKKLFIDFCVFKDNKMIFIEYNGHQHYKSVDYFGGEERYEQQIERDYAVQLYCKEHKIKLITIPYSEYDNIDNILKREL